MSGLGIDMGRAPTTGRGAKGNGTHYRRKSSNKHNNRGGGKHTSHAAVSRQRVQCAPLCENPGMLNVPAQTVHHTLPQKPVVTQPLRDVQSASVTVRETSPNDSDTTVSPGIPAIAGARIVSGNSVGMRFVSGPISDIMVVPDTSSAPPEVVDINNSAQSPVLASRPSHQLPAKPVTPTVPVERDTRVGIDVHLSIDQAVEGGCVHGVVRLQVPDHKSPTTAMLMAQPRVRLIGYESLRGDETRHVFYHHASVLDGDRSVDGPSEPYVLHGSTTQAAEDTQMLPCYASLPDNDGYYLGKRGEYELPFSLSLPIGRGARGSYRSAKAQVGYLVIASVRVKSFGEQHGGVAHCFKQIDLHPYINPTAALASAARPILARNTLQGSEPVVDLAAALHRETWVAGQRVYFDVSVRNSGTERLDRLGVALVRTESITQDGKESRTETVVSQDTLDAVGTSHNWWRGVDADAEQHFSHDFLLPDNVVTIVRGRHINVVYHLRISVGSSEAKAETEAAHVDLPVRAVSYVSIDPPPVKRNLAQSAGIFPSSVAAPQDPSKMIERVRSLEMLRSPRATMSLSGHLVPEPPRVRTAHHRRSLEFINHAIRSATARHNSPCAQEETPLGLGIELAGDAAAETASEASAAPPPHRPRAPAAQIPSLPVLEVPDWPEESEGDVSRSLVLGDETVDDVGLALDDRRDCDSNISVSWTGIIDAYDRTAESSVGHVDIDDAPPSRTTTPTREMRSNTPRMSQDLSQNTSFSAHSQRASVACINSQPTTPVKSTSMSSVAVTHAATAPRTLGARRSGFFVATSDSPVRVKAKLSSTELSSTPRDQRLRRTNSSHSLRSAVPVPILLSHIHEAGTEQDAPKEFVYANSRNNMHWNSGQSAFPVPGVEQSNIIGHTQGLNIELPVSPTVTTLPTQYVNTDLQLGSPTNAPQHSMQSGIQIGTPCAVPYNMMLKMQNGNQESMSSPLNQSPTQKHTERIASLLDEMLATMTDLRLDFKNAQYNASNEKLRQLGSLVSVAGALHEAIPAEQISPPHGTYMNSTVQSTPDVTRKRRSECFPELTPLKAARSNSVSLGSPHPIATPENVDGAPRQHVFTHSPAQFGMVPAVRRTVSEHSHDKTINDGFQLSQIQPKSPAKLFGQHVIENSQLGTPPLSESDTPDTISPLNNRTSNENTVESFDDETWESIGVTDKMNGGTDLPIELRVRLETIFHDFLNDLCSNLDATDDRGEPIHQTLMPKKMARLDESPDFRPFKFRIQAFTNAFQAAVTKAGISEEDCSIKLIKQFLWTQPYILRFNEDGKKSKSKGNHIWNIEAKKLATGKWEFRAFTPKITGETSKVAYVNEEWTWHLRVWDPQAASNSIKVVYSVNSLPDWIHWDDTSKVLTGTPTATSQGGEVSVNGLYVHLGQLNRLEHSFFLEVRPARTEANAGIHSDPARESVVDGIPSSSPAVSVENADTYFLAQPPASLQAPSMQQAAIPTSVAAAQQPVMANPSQAQNIYDAIIPPVDIPHVTATLSNGELRKHEVVEPARASHILSSIAFPFTPPVYTENYEPPLSIDQAVLATMPQAQNTMLAPQPSTALAPDMFGVPAHTPSTASTNGSLGSMSSSAGNLAFTPYATTPAFQNTIEQRQKAQMSSFMLSIPERRPGFFLSDHSGNTTPMSSMPNDISSCLPKTSNP
ncbi:hypothetical protein MCUN1_002925 [Malassezia cuniculi]|uniref:Arrestin C-terminal-like domain-containing protein n=1 Tax=Malassezia cuniculi TaxID=948313 RepID=A0AAF0EVR9_9BASI|nr:hypothetical protein MCUN1_002925 [Malassezia cuniculi]